MQSTVLWARQLHKTTNQHHLILWPNFEWNLAVDSPVMHYYLGEKFVVATLKFRYEWQWGRGEGLWGILWWNDDRFLHRVWYTLAPLSTWKINETDLLKGRSEGRWYLLYWVSFSLNNRWASAEYDQYGSSSFSTASSLVQSYPTSSSQKTAFGLYLPILMVSNTDSWINWFSCITRGRWLWDLGKYCMKITLQQIWEKNSPPHDIITIRALVWQVMNREVFHESPKSWHRRCGCKGQWPVTLVWFHLEAITNCFIRHPAQRRPKFIKFDIGSIPTTTEDISTTYGPKC